MNDIIDLATINFGGSGGSGSGSKSPDYNVDYSASDFRAPSES